MTPYTPHTVSLHSVSAWYVLGLVSFPVIVVYLYRFWKWFDDWLYLGGRDWVDGRTGGTNYSYNQGNTRAISPPAGKKTTTIERVTKTVTKPHLMPHERHKPPKAHAFGRIAGQEINITSDYEEKYLTSWELRHWNWVKKHEITCAEPIQTNSEAKPLEITPEVTLAEQKATILIDEGLVDDKKREKDEKRPKIGFLEKK